MFDFDPSRWQAIPEPELLPYEAPTTLGARSLLVLAPHPDDEVFGCGGTLALAAVQGLPVQVVVVSDGGAGGDAVIRERESRRAAQVLGYDRQADAIDFWRLPDRGVRPDALLVQRIRQRLRQRDADWLLAPSPFEIHPDHLAVCRAAVDAVALEAAAGRQIQLVFFEVGQAQIANRLVDITAMLPKKVAAMQCFESQLAAQRYDEQLVAFNRMRAYTLGSTVTHAEAFWAVDPATAVRGPAGLVDHVTRTLARRLGAH